MSEKDQRDNLQAAGLSAQDGVTVFGWVRGDLKWVSCFLNYKFLEQIASLCS